MLLSSIQVYSDYDEKVILREICLSLEDIENFAGQYQNVIEELRRRRKEDQEEEGVLLDIEYELESIRTDEINYHYILSLIQALIENRENLIGKKEKSLVDNYIEDLNKSNPKVIQPHLQTLAEMSKQMPRAIRISLSSISWMR